MSDHDGSAYDAVVIGGGAAGLSGALLLARARLRVAVVDAGAPRNAPASHMQGFLGRDGTPPADLLAAGRREVAGYGGDLVPGTVATVRPGFRVDLADGRTLRAERILVATGVLDELPDVPGIEARWGRDVHLCPYCHGYEVRDRAIVVLATQPQSVQQALLLRGWSDDVVLLEHTYALSDDERTRLAARGVRTVAGRATGLVIRDDALRAVATTGDPALLPLSVLFITPRFTARTEMLRDLGCEMEENGRLVVDPTGATTVPGVWAAGNVVDPPAQVITAAGAAVAAARALHADFVAEEVDRRVAVR